MSLTDKTYQPCPTNSDTNSYHIVCIHSLAEVLSLGGGGGRKRPPPPPPPPCSEVPAHEIIQHKYVTLQHTVVLFVICQTYLEAFACYDSFFINSLNTFSTDFAFSLQSAPFPFKAHEERCGPYLPLSDCLEVFIDFQTAVFIISFIL